MKTILMVLALSLCTSVSANLHKHIWMNVDLESIGTYRNILSDNVKNHCNSRADLAVTVSSRVSDVNLEYQLKSLGAYLATNQNHLPFIEVQALQKIVINAYAEPDTTAPDMYGDEVFESCMMYYLILK